MSNRKLQITIFAAFAALGLAFGPAAAVAKNGEQHGNSNGTHNSSNWGHKGSKWGSMKNGAPKHDKISMKGHGDKHDKHDKHGKHDKWDKHDKWKHAHHHHKWHHKKHYYEQPTTYTYVKPVYTTPSYSLHQADLRLLAAAEQSLHLPDQGVRQRRGCGLQGSLHQGDGGLQQGYEKD